MNDDSPVLVPLTRGGVVVVEWRDWQRVTARRWSMGPMQVYPCCGRETLHRFIVGAKQGEEVAHLNGNVFDCRRANLRVVTHRENMSQRHRKGRRPFVGVSGRLESRFQAVVGTRYYYGGPSEVDAILVRDHAVRCLLGYAATYNFPREGELRYDAHMQRTLPSEDEVRDSFAVLAFRARSAAALWMERRAWATASVTGASAVTNLSARPLEIGDLTLEPAATVVKICEGDVVFRGAAPIGRNVRRAAIGTAREAMIRLLEAPWELWVDQGPGCGGAVMVGSLPSSEAGIPDAAKFAGPRPSPALRGISSDIPPAAPLVTKLRTGKERGTCAIPREKAEIESKTAKTGSKATERSADTPERALHMSKEPSEPKEGGLVDQKRREALIALSADAAQGFVKAISDAEPRLRLERWPWIKPLLDDVVMHLVLVEQAEGIEFTELKPTDPKTAFVRFEMIMKLRERLRKSLMDLQTACLNAVLPDSDGPAAVYARLHMAVDDAMRHLLKLDRKPNGPGTPLDAARSDTQAVASSAELRLGGPEDDPGRAELLLGHPGDEAPIPADDVD